MDWSLMHRFVVDRSGVMNRSLMDGSGMVNWLHVMMYWGFVYGGGVMNNWLMMSRDWSVMRGDLMGLIVMSLGNHSVLRYWFVMNRRRDVNDRLMMHGGLMHWLVMNDGRCVMDRCLMHWLGMISLRKSLEVWLLLILSGVLIL